MFSQGRITGSITYDDIASTSAPQGLNANQAPGASLDKVLNELFNGGNGPAASTHYSINYDPGMNSVDPTGSTTGNVWTAGTIYNQTG